MSQTTKYVSERVKNAGINLGRILDDMAPFTELKAHWPNAGKFPLAQWLERIVDDRRNGIVAHAEHLKLTFEKMEVTLKRIAADFDGLDGENAQKVAGALKDMQTTIGSEITQLDENTEKQQTNFTPSGKNNGTDGDGYNDDLNAPVGRDEPDDDDDDDDDDEHEHQRKQLVEKGEGDKHGGGGGPK